MPASSALGARRNKTEASCPCEGRKKREGEKKFLRSLLYHFRAACRKISPPKAGNGKGAFGRKEGEKGGYG